MPNIEIITTDNADRLEAHVESMFDTYQYEFSLAPWNEVSRCDQDECAVEFTALEVGTPCPDCTTEMGPAYTVDEMYGKWSKLLHQDNGLIEIAHNDEQQMLRTTLVRPLASQALFAQKYSSVPAMEQWIPENLPDILVWIDDTFANRRLSPTGNMNERGRTLLRVAEYYRDIDAVFTRTKAPQIVSATLRDVGPYTDLYIGTEGVGNEVFRPARSRSTVPDARTMIGIDLDALRTNGL